MFSAVKGYLYAAGALALAAAYAVFQYRGNKIVELEADVQEAESKAAVTEKVIEGEREIMGYESANAVEAVKAEASVVIAAIVQETILPAIVEGKDAEKVTAKFYSI